MTRSASPHTPAAAVDRLVALRRAAWRRYPEFDVDSDEALAALQDEAERTVAASDVVRMFDDRAALLLWTTPTSLGWEAQRGRVEVAEDDREHIEPVVALLREVFGERPELGMLPLGVTLTAAIQAGLDAFVRTMQSACAEAGTGFVVLRDGEVLGQGSAHTRSDPLMGHVGGLGIALRPEIRGRGIGKLLYERLLERLIAEDVRVIRGRTANPAVLHLAERMGRSVRAWQLELGSPGRPSSEGREAPAR